MLAVPAGFLSIIESSHLSQIESSLEDSRRREITLITSYTFVLEIGPSKNWTGTQENDKRESVGTWNF